MNINFFSNCDSYNYNYISCFFNLKDQYIFVSKKVCYSSFNMMTSMQCKRVWQIDDINKSVLRAIVRNPYSRLVSIYHIYCYQFKKEPNNFRDWAIKKLREEVEFPTKTLNYQINLSKIFSSCNRFPDYLIRQEFLEEDIRNLWFIKENMSEELEIIIQDNIVNNGYLTEFGKRDPWQEYYNNSLSNYVYNFLEKDFQLFGYDKNSWKNGTP